MTEVRTPPAKITVLVVDDSAYNRRSIADALAAEGSVEVVGKAADGEEALRLAAQLKPDCITLDLEMPRMDGFTFLRILMARQPTPVIVVSSYSQKETVFKALELGAIDFVAKPSRQFPADSAVLRDLLQKVLIVRHLRPIAMARPRFALSRASEPLIRSGEPPSHRAPPPLKHLVAIASSTGGPTAIVELFAKLPERFPGALLIAQHMPEKFTKSFAERLDRRGPLRVVEAQDGDVVSARRAYVCPGKMCMEIVGGSQGLEPRVRLTPPGPQDRYVPSGDRLLASVAQAAGSRALGVILTGMGDDGVSGARAIRASGGSVYAESEETAVVYGMPGAAVRAGVVNESMPLPALIDFLAQLT